MNTPLVVPPPGVLANDIGGGVLSAVLVGTVSNGVLDPCLIDGVDKAPELQALANSFWYALYTWPAGILLTTVWLLVLFWHRTRWKRKVGFE